jgi:phenylalanyl-tRNA synthetase beta chain
MRVSYNWLLDYINPGMSAEELAERLTLSGVEVGAVERFGPELPGVVTGTVQTLEPHPGRDNLILVGTDIGGEILHIVCGAKNMKPGDKVAVARPGAILPGDRRIDSAIIYGAASEGMICSAKELGLELGSDDEILILDDSSPTGEPVDKLLEFDDKILYLELTPNRSDCLGMLGVAYEVAALTGRQVKLPPLTPTEVPRETSDAVKITVEDPGLCPRYTARVAQNIKISSSPLWLQLRLLKAGIRPISNVVDITNYVMWEYGQPLHAFDLKLLKNSQIVVRRAREGERLKTLDGVERKLDPDVLVIADGNEPVGLAGVMGGEATEITDSTTEIVIEAAAFNPANIRCTARRFTLPSEASQRFEKGINHETVTLAQDRAALLINELIKGDILTGAIDLNYSTAAACHVTVDPERVNKILGMKIPSDEITGILDRLGFAVREEKDGHLNVTVPLRRPDVTIEEDIVEEVVRLHGFDRIPVTLPRGELLENRESREERLKSQVKDILTSCGYYECINYSFLNPANLVRLRLPEDDYRLLAIPVRNPFSEEQAVMRTTLLPGLLKSIQHNLSFRELNLMFFELGSVYIPSSLPLEELPDEKVKLAMAVTGLSPEPNWIVPSREADFYTLKGALEALFNRFQIKNVLFEAAAEPFTHPTRSAVIMVDGKQIGFIGQLHPEVAEAWDINQAVTVCEIDVAVLVSIANLVPRIAVLPRYPAATRDLALVVPKEVSALQIEKAIRKAGGGLVSQVRLFDLYQGKQVPGGHRSLAYSITFRHEEGTLTEAEINKVQGNIESALFSLGASLRS